MQKAIIIGNLGRDPDLRMTQSGKPVLNFSVAVNERRGENETTTWYDVSVWNERQAEGLNSFLTRGHLVYVEGRLSQRIYTKRDGTMGASLSIDAREVQVLNRIEREATAATTPEPVTDAAFDPDEIPF